MAGSQANIANFFAPLRGPGRSAASLLEDLILFDPQKRIEPNYHLLDDGARSFAQAQFVGELLPEGSCLHDFQLKKRQSAPPEIDESPNPTSVWQVAVVCRKCRVHLLLIVDYTSAWQEDPCPKWNNPLHHLVRSTWRQDAAYRDLQRAGNNVDEVYVYECSAPKCSALITVQLSPPVLSDATVHLLVDKELLTKRTNAAFEAKAGHTEGMKRPTPLDVLADLRAYLRNSWTRSERSEISLDNKRFVVRFGPEGAACRKALLAMGFELKPAISWVVPQPVANDSAPLQNPHNILLDNTEAELDVLIEARPEEERSVSQDNTHLEPAALQMARVLSSRNYDIDPAFRGISLSLWNRPRPFTILGIPQNASDDLVIWAYQRQNMLEDQQPAHMAQLMTALEDIQRQRQSEKLTNQVAVERSMGRYGEQTIADAYRSLSLPTNGDVDDETIIGSFTARLCDAPNQEQEMRQCIAVLGDYRKSRRLLDLANNTVSTYEDALKFLDANESVDDSFLVSMYLTKVSDSAASAEMAKKSMQVIAEHRNSDPLREFIARGYQGDLEQSKMDIGEAYSLFSVGDRTIDDVSLWAIYELALEDAVTSRERLLQAMMLIAEDRNSSYLRSRLNMPEGQLDDQMALISNEPVGLDNIGNTCYLNSLLQSLFTIATVRAIVLDFDNYRQDLNDPNISKKQVGQRPVTIKEIRSSQSFVVRLAELFNQMITAPARAIRPTPELARLTLETDLAKQRRNSTLQSERRPTLGMLDERPIIGPMPRPLISDNTEEPLESPKSLDAAAPTYPNLDMIEMEVPQKNGVIPAEQKDEDDDASDTTLVSQSQSLNGSNSPNQLEQMVPKVIGSGTPLSTAELAPQQSNVSEPESGVDTDTVMSRDEPSSFAQILSPDPTTNDNATSSEVKQIVYQPPPGAPPPVPPRPTAMRILEEYARQQDVTEVLSHAVVQLSCAIRGLGVDRRDQQLDEIHDTFYGEQQQLILTGPASPQSPVSFLFLNLPIHNEPKDVYGAFDNFFDVEDIGGSARYNAITKLPPVLCFALTRSFTESVPKGQTARNIKLDYHVDIPTTLFMDRYMAGPSPSPLLQRRTQTWQYKKELRTLTSRLSQLEPQGAAPVDEQLNTSIAVIQHLADFSAAEKLDGLAMDPTCFAVLTELPQKIRHEREKIAARIAVLEQQINDSFTDAAFRKEEYKLHAVFFHRGVASSGHYWIYIFDHVQEIWRKYNDETVTQVANLKEIFGDPHNDRSNPNWSPYSPATPYFMMYVRNDQLPIGTAQEIIVETVKRNPIISPPPPITNEMSWSATADVSDEGIDVRPLGSDTPEHDDGTGVQSSHHEFADQPSQMSHMPPNLPRLHDQDPQNQGQQIHDYDYVNIGSVMQHNRPSTEQNYQESWDEQQLKRAIKRSLQAQQKKEGDWDDSENMDVSPNAW